MDGQQFQIIAQQVIEKAQQRGASMSEAFLASSKELLIEVSNQVVETLKMAEERGLGVRIFKDGRMGFAYTADLNPAQIDQIIDEALANSRQSTVDDGNVLPKPAPKYPALDLYDPQINSVPVEHKIELTRQIERIGRQYDPRVKITEKAGYEDSEYYVTIVNSYGLNVSYRGAYCGAYLMVVAEENGDNQTGFGMQYRRKFRDLNATQIGQEAAEKAVRMLGAKKINTQKVPVVFDPYVATNFLGILAPALSAEAVQKGKSLFAGKVNQLVGSDKITLIDDGMLPDGIASSPFDGEGVPTARTVLIERGQLKGFLHNTYTAAKDGVVSTGNGMRSSYKGTPEIGTTNFYILPGELSVEELLKDIASGLYVTEVMGMHTANPISGDFSVGAAGLWIENGQLAYPVRGVAIAGNILDLLASIDAVASDLTFFGGRGAPTCRVAKMTVSGS